MTYLITLSFELEPDDSTFGAIIDDLLELPGILAAGVDLRTPSSASSPRLTVTVDTRLIDPDDFARFFGDSTFADFLTDRDPEFAPA